MDANAALLALVAFAIGLFYAVGGVLLMRRLALETVMDQVLAALGDPDAGAEQRRTRLMTLGAVLTLASGLSLMLLSRWAPAIFAVSALAYGAYLAWSARALPPQDALERDGRRATVRAFLLYLGVFAFVLLLERAGMLRGWFEPALLEPLLLLGCSAALAWAVQRPTRAGPSPAGLTPREDPRAPPRPVALRLQPGYRWPPLRDDEEGHAVDPAGLGLSAALAERIAAWDAAFQAAIDADDPVATHFPDLAAERAWVDEGEAIAEALAAEWPGPVRVAISDLEGLLHHARHDHDPAEPAPPGRAAETARQCGVAEIREAIARLDALAREAAALPGRDGGAQDDIARTQQFLSDVLAALPARYVPEVERGLAGAAPQTRQRVRIALDRRREGEGGSRSGGTT